MSQEKTSDHFTQLDIFINAQGLSSFDRRRAGIDTNNFDLASELYKKICKRSGIAPVPLRAVPNNEERELLRRAVAAGLIDYSYKRSGKTNYLRVGGTSTLRTKSRRSAVVGHPAMVVGIPYRIEHLQRDEEHIIQDMTEVTPQLLGSIAIDMCAWEDVEVAWRNGQLKRIQRELFRSSISTGRTRELQAVASPETAGIIEQYLFNNSGTALQQLKATKSELEELQRLSVDTLAKISQDDIKDIIRDSMGDRAVDTGYIDQRIREITIERALHIDMLLSREKRQEIRDNAPSIIDHYGQHLKLQYHQGIPEHHINKLEDILSWSSIPTLSDGRIVKLIYDRRVYQIDELRELLSAT